MPLRKKILLSMVVPAVLLLTVGVVGVASLAHLKQAAGRILSHNYHSIEEARNMEQVVRLLETIALDARAGDVARTDTLIARFDGSLSRCEANITETGEHSILERIRVVWEALKSQLPTEPPADATIASLRSAHEFGRQLNEQIDALIALNKRAMFAYEQQTRHLADMTLWAVSGAAILAVAALAWFSLVSARRIAGPIVEVSSRLHRALNPDASERCRDTEPIDEIYVLKEELEKLLQRLARHEDEQHKRLLHMESRLAFVINEVLEGLVLIDTDRKIIAVNRVAREILGLGEGQAKRLDEIQAREDICAMLRPLMDGIFQPERDLGELRFGEGEAERIYRPRVLTIPSGAGEPEGYLLLFWDVTEQRRFEESRRKFISMLSHQLKTPMTSLSMSVNLLREKLEGMGAAQAELLSIASENCRSLGGLISDLIEAAREPSPDLSLRFRYIDIIKLLRTGLRPLIPQAEEKGIRISVPEGDAVHAWVDPVKFPWVVTNIAGNALRYTAQGGRIDVVVDTTDAGLIVEISDTGVGVAQQDLACVFEPYVTLDPEPEQGTHGLGLAIAKEIVEAHRGTISVESVLGKGTAFRIALPFDCREAA